MTGLEKLLVWGALTQCAHLGDKEAVLTREEVGPYFDSLLVGFRIANSHGLTRINEIVYEDDGFETSVVFEQFLTAEGRTFVSSPAPAYQPTASELRHLELGVQRAEARLKARADRAK